MLCSTSRRLPMLVAWLVLASALLVPFQCMGNALLVLVKALRVIASALFNRLLMFFILC